MIDIIIFGSAISIVLSVIYKKYKNPSSSCSSCSGCKHKNNCDKI